MSTHEDSLHGTPESCYRAGMELLEAMRRQAYLARIAAEDGVWMETISRLHILERELDGLAHDCAEKLAETERRPHLPPITRRANWQALDRVREEMREDATALGHYLASVESRMEAAQERLDKQGGQS